MLVDAWDKTTGKRLPYLVPEHHIGHKVFGPNLTSQPPALAGGSVVKPAGKSATKKEDQ